MSPPEAVPDPRLHSVTNRPSGDGLSLIDVVHAVRDHWIRSLIIIVASVTLSATVAALMEPVYRAEVVLAPVSQDDTGAALAGLAGQLGGLASLAGVSVPGSADTAVSIATLGSRSLLETFIQDRKLLPLLFASDWDSAAGKWQSDDPSDVPTMNDGVDLLARDVREIFKDQETGLVTLSVVWRGRQEAADWANAMVDLTNARLRRQAIVDARRNIEYLEQELKKTDVVSIQQVINRLIESDMQRITVATVTPEYAFKVIDPARPPDADMYVQPNWPLMLFAGFMVGLTLALLTAVWSRTRAQSPKA